MKTSQRSKKCFLSLIVPAYKQEKTIQKDILKIKNVMDTLKQLYEIIVVVDGMVDKTYHRAKKIKTRKIKVIGYKHNRGKGYAVRYGMAKSKGNIIAFLDAGMDLHPKGLNILLDIMKKNNAHIVIGSKLHPLSEVSYPWQRVVLSIGYRSLVKILFGLSISDTQVGLKLFRRKVLEDVLPRLLVKEYAFDIEILAVAYSLGYRNIQEAPITLRFRKWSSITSKGFLFIIYRMLWDTAAVFYRLRIKHYYDINNKKLWKFDKELNFKVRLS